MLFCSACCEELATKNSITEMHIKSQKHLRGKMKLAKKNQCELTIIEALKKFDRDHHPVGETLPDFTHIYVVTAMLTASVALNKIDSFR